MNILIEDAETLEYFTSPGHWSKNAAKGKTFPTTITAFETAQKELIGKFNIVSHIPRTTQFVNLKHGRGKAN